MICAHKSIDPLSAPMLETNADEHRSTENVQDKKTS